MHHNLLELLKRPQFDPSRDLPAAGLAVLTILLGLMGDPAREALRYDRGGILENQEWWRAASGHFVHLGWAHLWLNLAGCLLVWFLFRRDYDLRQWLFVVVVCLAFMSGGFLLLNPHLDWYVGLSGLLHGLFAAGMLSWLQDRSWESWLMLVIFVAKLAWEQLVGPLPFTDASAGGPVVVDAHLYGAVGGALAVVLMRGRTLLRSRV